MTTFVAVQATIAYVPDSEVFDHGDSQVLGYKILAPSEPVKEWAVEELCRDTGNAVINILTSHAHDRGIYTIIFVMGMWGTRDNLSGEYLSESVLDKVVSITRIKRKHFDYQKYSAEEGSLDAFFSD